METLGAGELRLNFPAEPWSERKWFFNPFGWQLVFFTGFAFMRGWIPAPPVRAWLIERYGSYVSYDPPLTLATAPLWLAPLALLALGLWIARGSFRRRRG